MSDTLKIRKGTAARLGLRQPIRGLLILPRSISPEEFAAFKDWFEETYPRGHRYIYRVEEVAPSEPVRRRWWRWWR